MDTSAILEKALDTWGTLAGYSLAPIYYLIEFTTKYLLNIPGAIGATLVVYASFKLYVNYSGFNIKQVLSWSSFLLVVGLGLGTFQNGPIVALETLLIGPGFLFGLMIAIFVCFGPIVFPYFVFKGGMRIIFDLITHNWLTIVASIILAISGFLYARANFEEELNIVYNVVMFALFGYVLIGGLVFQAEVDSRVRSKKNTFSGLFKNREQLEDEAREELEQERAQR
ncbi:hypothetical protein [Vibrio sp. THAF190c]|uniref:hypothetical protein n=1 Tax=Vibrio sp. THAF190c TaxID=2587865 RepID=UPI0012681131|nr:hypothetical protein [Vibrio sp. THAF190c]QFT13535.1 hypothetical protein FIV04_26630 [Vibrio sp. THAF190c]